MLDLTITPHHGESVGTLMGAIGRGVGFRSKAARSRVVDLEVIVDDYLFDNGDANRLETLQESYPPSFTRGSILFIHGKPSFKAPPQIPCPKGHGLLKREQTTISFQHAPAESRDQAVAGWVCPVCGEAYVPGVIAREAHRRAFQRAGASGSVV